MAKRRQHPWELMRKTVLLGGSYAAWLSVDEENRWREFVRTDPAAKRAYAALDLASSIVRSCENFGTIYFATDRDLAQCSMRLDRALAASRAAQIPMARIAKQWVAAQKREVDAECAAAEKRDEQQRATRARRTKARMAKTRAKNTKRAKN